VSFSLIIPNRLGTVIKRETDSEGTEWTSPEPPVEKKQKQKRNFRGKSKVKETSPKVSEPLIPECASCLRILYMESGGDFRCWFLKCGHVICGRCLKKAKERCEEVKRQESGKVIEIEDDENENGIGMVKEEEFEVESLVGPKRNLRSSRQKRKELNGVESRNFTSSLKSKGKGKGKEDPDGIGVEMEWTSCPVLGCDGDAGDLLAEDGEDGAPWEGFI
jgi:hypothetical protein